MSSSFHEKWLNNEYYFTSRRIKVHLRKFYQIHSSLHQTTQQTDDLQYFHQRLPSTLALTYTGSCTLDITLATSSHT